MTPDEARKAALSLVVKWGENVTSGSPVGHLEVLIAAALLSAYEQGVTDGKAKVETQEP